MKQTLLGLSFMLVTPAFASQALFEALDGEEVVLPSPRAEVHSQKMVAGVTCLKVDHIVDGLSFSCEVDAELLDSEVLYKSLKLEEVVLPTPRTYYTYQKAVGNLTCLKTSDLDGEDSYNCKFKF